MGTIEDNLKCISRRALPAFALLAVWALVSALSLPPLGGAAANPGGNRLPAGFMAPNPLPTVQPSLTAPWTPLPTFTATPVGSATPVGTATPCQGAAQDVPPTHPDYEAIRFLLCRGAMETFPCGQPGEPCVPPNNYPYFRPGTLVTREETTMYLTLAEGWALYCPGTPTFTDVPPSSRFYCFVETLYHYGAISGYNDGTFRPGNPVTRAQLAKIIVLSQGWALYSPPAPTFTDVPASHAFYPYIETAYSHNVMEGFCDGTFRPDNPVSRAELARYLYAAVTQPGWPTHRAPTLLSTCIPLLTATPTPTGTVTATGATSTSTPSGVPASTITATPSIPAPTTTNTPTGTPTLIPMTVSDVHPSDYFYEAVRMLYGRGIISGYADNTFRPYNNTTRGQLSKIIVLAKGWSVYNPITATFRDVPMGSPFFAYVETTYAHQVISGYGCGDDCLEFRPGNSITRGQLCKIVVLAQEWPLYDPPSPTFIDVPPADPFFRYVETAYSRGIISGYDCGPGCLEFRPGNNAIRGQICKIVYGASN